MKALVGVGCLSRINIAVPKCFTAFSYISSPFFRKHFISVRSWNWPIEHQTSLPARVSLSRDHSSTDQMAPVTTKNTSGPTPSDDTFLFVNISGPTDGRHRGPSTQTRIRQHVMRDITKAQRKAPPNRRAKSKKGNSKKKMRHAKTLDASAPEGQSEESRDHESATGSIVSYISGSTIDESTLGTPDRCRTELQKPTPLVDFTLDQHPLTMLYRRLADTSRFPAYSLAYAVTQNVKVNRKLHNPSFSSFTPSM